MADQGAALDCSNTRFLHANHQGSIVAAADCWGNRTTVATYDEYGIPGSNNWGRFQYTGQAWIPELGMYYYKARIYSPTLGRFLQTDPVGYADQVNLYAYVGNDPVNRGDPSGLATCPILIFTDCGGDRSKKSQEAPTKGDGSYLKYGVKQPNTRHGNPSSPSPAQKGPNSPSTAQRASNAAGNAGNALTAAEVAAGKTAIGPNGKLYSTGWANQYGKTVSVADGINALGRVVLVADVAIDVVQVNNGEMSKAEFALERGVDGVGLLGGVYGLVATALYEAQKNRPADECDKCMEP